MDTIHVVKEITPTTSCLSPQYLGSTSLQTSTKFKELLRNIINCCKLQIVCKNKTR